MTCRLETFLARGAQASRVTIPTTRLFEDVILEPRLFGGRISVWQETKRNEWRRPFRAFVLGRRRAEDRFDILVRFHREAARIKEPS